DRWVAGREDAVTTATNAGQQYVNSSYYSSGIADLYTYGSWYPVSGYGNCWRPYGVGLGWSPFASGGGVVDPGVWSTFIGGQPWGWLPYHYGGWVFDPLFGWLWSPGFGFGFGGPVFRPVTGVFIRSKTGLIGLVPVHPLDVRGKEPINMAKGVFPVAGGTVAQQALASTTAAGESWKVLKAPPRESLTNTTVAASAAPPRVSRTIVGGGSNARVVTLDRNSSIVYDAREHRFVNGAAVTQTGEAKSTGKTDATREAFTSQRAAQGRAEASAPASVRVPAASMRAAAPPPRAMAPPPARASTGSYSGGWSQGASSRGLARAPAAHSAPAASASHASSAGSSGHPH